jgi:hypothetical protein
MINEKAIVLAKYPYAVANESKDWRSYHRWVIHMEGGIPMIIGGGLTKADAWHNAWVHIDTAERGKARGGEGRSRI